MDDAYRDTLNLLRKAVLDENCHALPSPGWEGIYSMSRIHGVLGITGPYALSHGIVPDRNRRRINRECVDLYGRMALKAAQTQAVCRMLTDACIPHILVKGMVVRDYYPLPEMRTFGDTDILIRGTDRQKVHVMMIGAGFTPGADWEPSYSYTKSISEIEVHTELLDTDISEKLGCREYFRSTMWENAVERSSYEYIFRPEYHFLYLVTHIAKHMSGSGAGIRMFLDLAYMVQREQNMDWKEIGDGIKAMGLEKLFSCTIMLLERCFSCRLPVTAIPVSEEDFLLFLTYVMEAGTFGFENRDSGAVILGRNEIPEGHGREIMKRLFPPVSEMEARYIYLQKHPWLLPAAWVHRLFLTAQDTWAHLDMARKILEADEKEAERIRRVRRIVGL